MSLKKNVIVHTAAEQDVMVNATVKGKVVQARVPGIAVEVVDMDDGRSHSHTFDEDLDEVRELFVPGQQLTVSFARKAGAPTIKPEDADPEAAQEFMAGTITEDQMTESQREDYKHQQAEIKSGKADPITQPKK